MDTGLIELLRCPTCGLPVEEGVEALLPAPSAGPLTRPLGGIPRFAGEGYVASFGRQWNRYDVARDEEDEATFQRQNRC